MEPGALTSQKLVSFLLHFLMISGKRKTSKKTKRKQLCELQGVKVPQRGARGGGSGYLFNSWNYIFRSS